MLLDCRIASKFLCAWFLHSKTFLIRFVHLPEAVMCPACLRGSDRWPLLLGYCCAIPCRAVDGFCKPSSYQLIGQLRPCRSAECSGFGGRRMRYHLAGVANSLFLFVLGCAGAVRFVAGQDFPYDPSGLIGHGDSGDTGRLAFRQPGQPFACPFRMRSRLSDERGHANDQ